MVVEHFDNNEGSDVDTGIDDGVSNVVLFVGIFCKVHVLSCNADFFWRYALYADTVFQAIHNVTILVAEIIILIVRNNNDTRNVFVIENKKREGQFQFTPNKSLAQQ